MIPAISSLLFDRINAALPQTQCTRCGYPDCAAYAQAISAGNANINQCPPGGWEGVERLALITGLPALPLNPANGVQGPRAVAVIDEDWCIGCTLCIKACPTDAIMGSNKMMHTVIEPYCTGCGLCVPSCPVDCISLDNVTGTRAGWSAWSPLQADTARQRYEFHRSHSNSRGTELEALPQESSLAMQTPPDQPVVAASEEAQRKRAVIQAAMASARARRSRD